jgi:hypothetical protein
MNQELEEIKNIEDYLLERLNEKEKAAFKEKMLKEPDFARRVETQRVVVKRIQQIALKQSIKKVHRSFLIKRKFSFKNNVFRYTFNIVLTIIAIALVAYAIWLNS